MYINFSIFAAKVRAIGSKAEGLVPMSALLETYAVSGRSNFVRALHQQFLKKKIRFPILEFMALQMFNDIPSGQQLRVLHETIRLREMGGNVIAGTILQLRLGKHFKQSIEKAAAYIIDGNAWYVCDIIGERVFGHALLSYPARTIPLLKTYIKHTNKWMVRSVGVAAHYAIKKGLQKTDSERLFQMLLSCAAEKDIHTKKGIGWAAKTTAKFHPDIINQYKDRIEDNVLVKQWFRTKINIGLSRSFKYASRYHS